MRHLGARRLGLAALIVAAAFAMGQSCGGALSPSAAPSTSDSDGDAVPDYLDNCRLVPNRSQLDTGPQGQAHCDGAHPNENDDGPVEFGTCRNDPSLACLVSSDCARGNACDCDFDGDGGCDIDDFNRFLGDYATGVDSAGTDMNGDGLVDDLDFALFEPLFADGEPGAGASEARVIDADDSAGACFDRRQGRRLWQSEGRAEHFPNSVSNDLLDCSVDLTLLPDLGILTTSAEFTAMATNKNNPTDAFVGAGSCPNAAFSTGNKLAPRACDAHDLCLDHCGYATDECNRQFYRDLFATCEALVGQESADCRAPCLNYARAYASVIASVANGSLTPILSPPVGAGADPNALEAPDLANCQCGPPVCEVEADCLNQATAPLGSLCDRGYCVHVFGNDCDSDADCSPGYRCAPDPDPTKSDCIWDVRGLPDRRGTPPPVCGDGLCEEPVETCASTSCPNDCGVGPSVAEAFGRCEVGDACLNDLDCAEGACLHGQCRTLAVGSRCDEASDCTSEICSVISNTCTGICLQDQDCAPDTCLLGDCIPLRPNFSVCDSNGDCQSGICNFGFCVDSILPNGFPCTNNAACASGVCNNAFCIAANSVAAGGTCTTNGACVGGDCVGPADVGFCAGFCGDDICTLVPNGETCFQEACQDDCGACPNGTPGCDADADCASNFCRLGFCFASGTINGGAPCLFDQECKSGDCIAPLCKSTCGDGICTVLPTLETVSSCFQDCCAANGTLCALSSACCSGNCSFFACRP